MPNWCRGNLVVQGMKDNVKRFLLENFTGDDLKVLESDKELIIRSKEAIFIEGTIRNVVGNDIVFNFASEGIIKECTMNGFMAAWSISPEPYKQMSREYEIDIAVCGGDILGGFAQWIEIQKGEIIINKVEELIFDFGDSDEEFIDEVPTGFSEDFSIDNDDWQPYKENEPFDYDDLPF